MEKAKRVAIYARVSTDGQTTDNQLRELVAAAQRHGWDVTAQYVDHGVSGAKGREARPAFNSMCKAMARREFELIAAWSVDRLGRSLQDLITFLGELQGKRLDLYLHQQGVDTTTPAGKALFQMMGVFAEFERSMIVERVKAGISRARAQGKRLGRPRLDVKMEAKVRTLRAEGKGIIRIAKEIGIGVGTVKRIIDTGAMA